MTTLPNGQIVATGMPTLSKGSPAQILPGGPIAAAVAKTAASQAEQAAAAKGAGVTMKGGGTPINVARVPTGNSIPGISYADNQAKLIGGLNQLKASAVYDGLAGGQPRLVGGRRRPRVPRTLRRRHYKSFDRPFEEPVIAAGRKSRRKTKNVRHRRRRTVHRRHGKHIHHTRRRRTVRR
jgi:hypothetical protein